MGFRVVMDLKDINRKHIKIKRGEQKQIPVNEEIKQAIKDEQSEGEKYAETIDRVLTTKHEMTELLAVMLGELSNTPSKMASLLSSIPENLSVLAEAIFNDRKRKKDPKSESE